ncbi:DUF6660 family protein [Sediminitomix flava]|uniref:Secreted protein n=1 Tax=Sediminitomix flava TaxID=379075 RepID=A0A315ZCM0_SEDFL|nr:DUF6660 family protein [Sediminitomix flava]PWJ43326.1 hypothetical protein BC781_102875 [Sediminitomix flava]
MRKIPFYILSVIVLILSVKPCADGEESILTDTIEANCLLDGDHEDGQLAFEFCSPFCPCGCGVSIEPLTFFTIHIPFFYSYHNINFPLIYSLTESFSEDLLDPPRLA